MNSFRLDPSYYSPFSVPSISQEELYTTVPAEEDEDVTAAVRRCFKLNEGRFRLNSEELLRIGNLTPMPKTEDSPTKTDDSPSVIPNSTPITRVVGSFSGLDKRKFYSCGTGVHETYGPVFLVHSPPSSKTLKEEEKPQGGFKTTRVGGDLWFLDPSGNPLEMYQGPIISAKNKGEMTESEKKYSKNEIEIIQRLEGKRGIVQLLGSYSYQSDKSKTIKDVIIMPFYESNLQRLLSKGDFHLASLEVQRKLQTDLLTGLAEIHKMGCVHRDIKPENIFVSDSDAIIGDFGLALDLNRDSCNQVMGTEFYLAPELMKALVYPFVYDGAIKSVVNASEKYTKAPIDVWSMGLVFYQMLDSSRLRSLSAMQLKNDAIGGRVNRFTQPEDPETFEHLVWEMLQVNPQKRITAEKALEKLIRISQKESSEFRTEASEHFQEEESSSPQVDSVFLSIKGKEKTDCCCRLF